jgi:single-stranded-DNA-specific exonuclease
MNITIWSAFATPNPTAALLSEDHQPLQTEGRKGCPSPVNGLYAPAMNMIWDILEPDPVTVRRLASDLEIETLIAAVLVNRQITSKTAAKAFLAPSLSDITPPGVIKDIEKAAERLIQALVTNEKILIFGDYDVDGVTATALLLDFLRIAGGRVSHYIPHRRKEGYGLQTSHIRKRILPGGYRLVITVDCGISSCEAVQMAKAQGIDVIITDHHLPSDSLPEAVAVINPKRDDCSAGLDHLAGVGMAFYLLIELRRQLRARGFWEGRPEPNLKQFCDLVALGTIADMVPLVEENRAFIRAGLKTMQSRPGIKALMGVSRVAPNRVGSDDVAFRLAPRLNAAGRVAHANLALRLLTTDNTHRATRIARTLDRLNTRRQDLETDIIDQIHHRIEAEPGILDRQALVMADRNWHEGVLGIVAARLTRKHTRPVILLAHNGVQARGSARSIPGIDLYRLLVSCETHLERFGGHAMAAGLALHVDQLKPFEEKLLTQLAAKTQPEDYRQRLTIDAEIALDQITPRLLDQLESLQPFGQTTPEPLFLARNIDVDSHRLVGGHHRQMVLRSGNKAASAGHHAIQFNIQPEQKPPTRYKRLAFHLRWNRWNGSKRPQLMVAATDAETDKS